MIPGIAATKLVARIECKELMQHSKTIFEACGWETCESDSNLKKPDPEYHLWIPDYKGDVNILTKQGRECWAYLIGLKVTRSDSLIINIEPRKGI